MKSSKAKADTSESIAAAGDEGEGAEVGTVLKSHGLVTIQVMEVLYGNRLLFVSDCVAYHQQGFHLIRIRIQHFRLNTDPDPDPIRIQGFDVQN